MRLGWTAPIAAAMYILAVAPIRAEAGDIPVQENFPGEVRVPLPPRSMAFAVELRLVPLPMVGGDGAQDAALPAPVASGANSDTGLAAADATVETDTVMAMQAQSHDLLATLTYAPESPPQLAQGPANAAAGAAQAMPPAREFLVFFGFGRTTLNAAARRIMDEAIAAHGKDKSGLVLRGFTDAPGSEKTNMTVSRKRALAVYDYMAKSGVAARDLGVDWQGSNDPRVPTRKPEAQNRRVEIGM